MIHIGIDPGQSGGIAWQDTDDKFGTNHAIKMPATERDIWDALNKFTSDETVAVLEYVASRPGQAAPGMFKFATHYGNLRMALIAAGIPFVTVTPKKWQSVMGCAKRGKDEPQSKHKTRLKARAQELHPELKVTLATADAILLSDYGLRTYPRPASGERERA